MSKNPKTHNKFISYKLKLMKLILLHLHQNRSNDMILTLKCCVLAIFPP